MKATGILNHVLGPGLRGPSRSHTAGAYPIASMARDLLGQTPCQARFEGSGLVAADHPTTVDLEPLSRSGKKLELRARSIGGGEVEIIQVDG